MYVVIVDFKIKPERLAEFMPLMLENARASRETEPGCRQFDVCVDPKEKTSVFLTSSTTIAPRSTRTWPPRISSASTPRSRRCSPARRCAR